MSVGSSAEHAELAASVAGLAERHAPRTALRASFEQLAAGEVPESWPAFVAQGLHAMHLPEELGGAGFGAIELAVAVEEAGRGLVPGPFLPTVLTSLVLAQSGDTSALKAYGPRFVEGATAATALDLGTLTARRTADGLVVDGSVTPVLGAPGANLLLLGAATDDGEVWFLTDTATVGALEGVDLTRSIGTVTASNLVVPDDAVVDGLTVERVRLLAAVLAAAEAVGLARWCFETALDYVKIREQFGKPVGSFQAVKHKCADIFTRVEVASAAAWDAARSLDDDEHQQSLAAAEAAVMCLPVARDISLDCVRLLGGIGFTWEHDIHLYQRRALSISQLLGPASDWAQRLATVALHTGRNFDLHMADSDDAFRAEIAAVIDEAAPLDKSERRRFLADHGLVSPQYPKPYGRAASPAQQVVIQQEYARAGVNQPSTIIGEFVLPTLLAYGRPDQQERYIAQTLRGDIEWCQLFSEPGAGSDLASLQTRAVRVEGGWQLTGQKVWNSKAQIADWAICLARSDPDASKHKGITYFLVDMRTPGIEVRPLRQSTGESEFNEVFLTDVFVPDDCLLGAPGEGWRVTTTTLANERVLISSGPSLTGFERLLALAQGDPDGFADSGRRALVGSLGAESYALRAAGLRATMQRLDGVQPGAASSVLKVASSEHQRAVAAAMVELTGPAAATNEGDAKAAIRAYLALPAVLIGGGTREIQLNVISERILGLPRG